MGAKGKEGAGGLAGMRIDFRIFPSGLAGGGGGHSEGIERGGRKEPADFSSPARTTGAWQPLPQLGGTRRWGALGNSGSSGYKLPAQPSGASATPVLESPDPANGVGSQSASAGVRRPEVRENR